MDKYEDDKDHTKVVQAPENNSSNYGTDHHRPYFMKRIAFITLLFVGNNMAKREPPAPIHDNFVIRYVTLYITANKKVC